MKPTTPSKMDDFCKGKKSGNYADPSRCDGFISCSNGITYKMDCPAHLWYNVKTDQCDYPANVQCKRKLIFHFFAIPIPLGASYTIAQLWNLIIGVSKLLLYFSETHCLNVILLVNLSILKSFRWVINDGYSTVYV